MSWPISVQMKVSPKKRPGRRCVSFLETIQLGPWLVWMFFFHFGSCCSFVFFLVSGFIFIGILDVASRPGGSWKGESDQRDGFAFFSLVSVFVFGG